MGSGSPESHVPVWSRASVQSPDAGLCAYLARWSLSETLGVGAVGGAMLEAYYVVAEDLKSWWDQAKQPAGHYCRDRDGK